MEEIGISEFKAKCLVLLERVRVTRQPIRITRHGTPVAEIVPPSLVQNRSAWIGSMKDSVEILGDIVSPPNEPSEWEPQRERREE
jgi:prevent-host-death family protein